MSQNKLDQEEKERVADRVADFFSDVHNFIKRSIRWQQPAASPLLVLIANLIFWICAFYVSHERQIYSLWSICVGLILLELIRLALKAPTALSDKYKHAKQLVATFEFTFGFLDSLLLIVPVCLSILFSHTAHRSKRRNRFSSIQEIRDCETSSEKLRLFGRHLCTAAPARFILQPILLEIWAIGYRKFDRVLIVGLTGTAASALEHSLVDISVWTAYGAALIALGAPAWRAYDVTDEFIRFVTSVARRIFFFVKGVVVGTCRALIGFVRLICHSIKAACLGVYQAVVTCINLVQTRIVLPIYHAVCWTVDWARYLVLLEWLPPLIAWCHTQITRGCDWLHQRVISPVWRVTKSVLVTVRYYVCGYWIPPLYRAIVARISAVTESIHSKYTASTAYIENKRQNFVSYTTQSYTNTKNSITNSCHAFTQFIHAQWLMPIGEHITQARDLFLYVFLGHWIQPLCDQVNERIIKKVLLCYSYCTQKLHEAYRALKQAVCYIIYGYWLLDLWSVTTTRAAQLSVHVHTHYIVPSATRMQQSCTHLLSSAHQFRLYLRAELTRLSQKVQSALLEARHWLYVQCCALTSATINFLLVSVLAPILNGLKSAIGSTMAYTNENVVQPFVQSVLLAAGDTVDLVHKQVLVPLWIYVEVQIKRWRHLIWIDYVEPSCIWLQTKLPDQNDGDLKEFLPSGMDSTGQTPHSWSRSRASSLEDEEGQKGSSTAGFTPTYGSRKQSEMSDMLRGSDSESDDEFTSGLQFTERATYIDSDSSDDEFSLREVVRGQRERSSKRSHRKQRTTGSDTNSGQSSARSSTRQHQPPSNPNSARSSLRQSQTTRPAAVIEEDDLLPEPITPNKPAQAPSESDRTPTKQTPTSSQREQSSFYKTTATVKASATIASSVAAEPQFHSAINQEKRAELDRASCTPSPTSDQSTASTWSNTLLAAYKNSRSYKPKNTRTSLPNKRTTDKDDEFEILDN